MVAFMPFVLLTKVRCAHWSLYNLGSCQSLLRKVAAMLKPAAPLKLCLPVSSSTKLWSCFEPTIRKIPLYARLIIGLP